MLPVVSGSLAGPLVVHRQPSNLVASPPCHVQDLRPRKRRGRNSWMGQGKGVKRTKACNAKSGSCAGAELAAAGSAGNDQADAPALLTSSSVLEPLAEQLLLEDTLALCQLQAERDWEFGD